LVPILVLAVIAVSAGHTDPSLAADIPPAEQKQPHLRVISPNGGEVWAEGETHEILWEAEDVEAVRIAVALGGKDKGHLGEERPIDARAGRFAWTIPRGFVTGFGVLEAANARIMIYDAHHEETRDLSDGFFTITGSRPPPDEGRPPERGDDREYSESIVLYFDALSGGDRRRAYDMLSPCKIVLTNADGSAVAFLPRPGYDRWLKAQESVRKIEVRKVERLVSSIDPGRDAARRGDALAVLGIRTYKVTLRIELSRENWTVGSGERTLFVFVVKGSDGRIRILEIGTGP
jgi:hypothetical protein